MANGLQVISVLLLLDDFFLYLELSWGVIDGEASFRQSFAFHYVFRIFSLNSLQTNCCLAHQFMHARFCNLLCIGTTTRPVWHCLFPCTREPLMLLISYLCFLAGTNYVTGHRVRRGYRCIHLLGSGARTILTTIVGDCWCHWMIFSHVNLTIVQLRVHTISSMIRSLDRLSRCDFDRWKLVH